MLCPSSPHMQDSPPASRPLHTASSSRSKADPSMEAAILQPDDDGRGAESSSRPTQVHKMGARDLPGAGKGGNAALFLPSTAPHKGRKQCEGRRGVPGHLSAQPVPGRLVLGSWLSAASNPSGGVRPCAEPQPDPGSEKVTAKPTSHTPSEPAAQTPCQD